ncbi:MULTISPECIES: class I SAM-dependent methyltransferase [Sphingobium]|uniref:class I SAM-dependent methyltransferase n=1 Tax=Sphingobium TaxID=165695 RepID=UPI0015EC8F67|nr:MULTISPECIES: class I SAM-dependent methyltransferase [Sphingobium]MCW2361746.1 SAM-dependent methyltransferase [Sphingobium sp. B10D3B]MCW2401575.1 SAM-dependent methyltransferase [Sphingobium sp. B10D7B]MCW2408555.1 SAM-dependent methyltransferase [Sphingobium xanthum]
MTVPVIFNEALRAQRRDRAAGNFAAHDFLYAAMADAMLERLDDVTRAFEYALVIGCPDRRLIDALAARGCSVTAADPGARFAQACGGDIIREDALPYPPERFDLILCCGTLDTINDLPGALIALHRALRPDGLLLLTMIGAGSLARLKAALLAADGERPAQRIHPQIDVRALGDLLARAGFTMPVADSDNLDVRYGSIFSLMADLRGMGAAQCLASPPPPLTRAGLSQAAAHFAQAADPDGRTRERFVVLHGSGWAPDPDQPRPARRGSATVSLAEALRPSRATEN